MAMYSSMEPEAKVSQEGPEAGQQIINMVYC